MAPPHPLLIIDTSVFLKDALSRTRSGSASQLLAIAPAIAQVVMCDEIRDEVFGVLGRHLGWPTSIAQRTYGPILDAARWITPAAERADHRLIAHDVDDTMLVRVAEAIYIDAIELIGPDQVRYVVSENTRHLRPGSAYAGFLFGTAHDVPWGLEGSRSVDCSWWSSSLEDGSASSARGEQRRSSAMPTKKPVADPDIAPEYDFKDAVPNPNADRYRDDHVPVADRAGGRGHPGQGPPASVAPS